MRNYYNYTRIRSISRHGIHRHTGFHNKIKAGFFRKAFDTILIPAMSKEKLLEELIQKKAKEGRISCAMLRKIAEEAGVPYKKAGETADELKIRVKQCDLGCF